MLQVITRVFASTRKQEDPDYLPPYFWHRYYVWRVFVYWLFAVPTPSIINLYFPEFDDGLLGIMRTAFLSLAFAVLFHTMPNRIRRLWATRQHEMVREKLLAQTRDEKTDAFSVAEAVTRLQLFSEDLKDYANSHPFYFSRLSIHRADWKGDGVQFQIYQLKKPKRTVTFHDEP